MSLVVGLSILGTLQAAPSHAAPPPTILYGHLSRQSDAYDGATTCTKHGGFRGTWQCLTEVTASAIEGVDLGTEATCQVRFAKVGDNETLAVWSQDGWTNNCSPLHLLNGQQAQVVRQNEGLGENAGCREVSFDQYTRTGHDDMVVLSRVEMYVGESFVGAYTTRSFLHRIRRDGTVSVCNHPDDQQQQQQLTSDPSSDR